MKNVDATKPERVERIGPDRVTITEQGVVIEAKHPMPDWEVRSLNPVPLYFGDKKYCLAEKRQTPGRFRMRYVLLPWPEDLTTSAANFYTYDAEAVAEREGALWGGHFDELGRALLLPFYPLLGLLWSGMQKRLMRFGFVPHSLSGVSIFSVFCLLFGEGVFLVVTINASLRSGTLVFGGVLRTLLPYDHFQLGTVSIPVAWVDGVLALALVLDIVVRFGRHVREDQWAGGFLEWLWPGSWGAGRARSQED